MAYLLEVHIVDAGDKTIKVSHQFWGLTQDEVETYKREHLASCDYFRSAERDGRLIEILEQIPDEELPTPEDFEEDEEQEYSR